MSNYQLEKNTKLNDRYEIYRSLGHGGFGITYAAEDTLMGQTVVIKEYFPQQLISGREDNTVIYSSAAHEKELFEKGRERFLTEAQVLASLFEVPGVVKVLDFFQENGTAYIVMEYVKGISLLEWMENQDRLLSFSESCKMLEPVMDALENIHKKGLLHRDISPDNIMVQEDGSLKLLDFGAAREFFLEHDREKTMTVLVKSGYAPPEQYDSKGKQGPWTDIYALCSVIYEMITGTMPQNALERQISDKLYVPSSFGAEITMEQEAALVTKGMAISSGSRYSSIKKMKSDFFAKPKEDKRGISIKKRIAIAVAAVVVIAAGFILFPEKAPEKEQAAGSYDRASDRYEEFLEFVENRAVSKETDPEDETATVYTLKKADAKEWGERCNKIMVDTTHDQFVEKFEAAGHDLKYIEKSETYTVKVKPYGIVETEFSIAKLYRCDDSMDVKIVYDLITEKIINLYIKVEVGGSGDMDSAAADAYMILNSNDEETREELIKGFEECREYAIEVERGYSGYNFDNMDFGYMSSPDFETEDNVTLVMSCIWGPAYYWP